MVHYLILFGFLFYFFFKLNQDILVKLCNLTKSTTSSLFRIFTIAAFTHQELLTNYSTPLSILVLFNNYDSLLLLLFLIRFGYIFKLLLNQKIKKNQESTIYEKERFPQVDG